MLHIYKQPQQSDKKQLIANIATVYYQLLSVDAQIKVAEETLINRDQSVETIQEKPDLLLKWCKTNRSSKYATEIIIADLKTIILENTMSVL
jgi:hypothetical protein